MNLKENFIAFMAIMRCDGFRVFRLWKQTLVPPIITSVLYFVIFGRVIGHRVGELHDYHYATFIAPGLIIMQMMMSSYQSTVACFFLAKMQGHIQEMLVSPISNGLILFSYMCVGMLRGLLVGAVVTIVASFFCDLHGFSVIIILVVSLLATALFSLAGLINGVFARSFDDIAIVPNFVITPLTYFAGVFYSINMLPSGFREASLVNPIYYIVASFRYGFLGYNGKMFETAILILVSFFIVVFATILLIFKKGAGLRT